MKNIQCFLIKWLMILAISLIFMPSIGQNTVGPFTYYPTNLGGTMRGQAQINCTPAVTGDIIAAFDPDDECVGAAPFTMVGGIAFINFIIYGDDLGGHGMHAGELFYLKVYDASTQTIIPYGQGLSGWQNTNFAPMPGYNNTSIIYNFISSTITVSPTLFDVPSIIGSATFEITSNADWTVVEEVPWLTVSQSNGTGTSTITINYESNEGVARSGVITVSVPCLSSVLVTVNQAAAPSNYLDVTPANRDVASSSGNTTFNVSSNTSWIVSDDATWLTTNPPSGNGDGTITAYFIANPGVQRVATITVTGNGVTPTRTVTVTQAAPIVTRTITVSSQNPASGVPITVSPADNSGDSNGTTQFTRIYNNATSVTLTAPETAGSNVFQKWLRNSVDFATTSAITFSATAADTYTAVYVTPTSVSVTFPDTTVMAGTRMEIPIYVGNLTGLNILSFQFSFTFDQTVIVPVDPYTITTGTISSQAGWSVIPNPNVPGQLTIGGIGTDPLTGSGKLVKLKFNVIGSYGDQTPIHFTSFTFNNGIPSVTLVDGSVTIPPKVCGDADQNSLIQAYDAALTLQHAIGLMVLPAQGILNADVNEDVTITAWDATLILRHSIGLPMPNGVTTCFGATYGFAPELPKNYEFGARLLNMIQTGKQTSADIKLRGINETGKVFAVSFDLTSPKATIQNLTMPNLPNGYLMFMNPTDGHTYRVGIINTNGVLTDDMTLHILMSGFNIATPLSISNILLNDQTMPDIRLSGNTVYENQLTDALVAYPNPFNSSTNITYQVTEDSPVQVEIFDMFGRKVKTLVSENLDNGFYNAVWNGESNTGSRVQQGWYIVRLKSAGSYNQIKVNLMY